MTAFLIFIGALVAIVVVAVVVNRMRGVRAHYLDAWTLEPGEERLLEDPAADFYAVPKLGQAKVMTFARRRRTHAVLTGTRFVIATRALASRRYMITHTILLDAQAEEGELGRLFTKDFVVMAARPDRMTVERDGGKTYLRIVPEPTESATNVEHCRLYSDMAPLFLERVTAG